MSDAPKLYTLQEVADLFQVHIKTASRWFRNRKVFRLNHSTVRISQAHLDKFTRECRSLPQPKTKTP